MRYVKRWKLRNGVEIVEVYIDGEPIFDVRVDERFVTSIFPGSFQKTEKMRKVLDWAVEHRYGVGILIEKALGRIEHEEEDE